MVNLILSVIGGCLTLMWGVAHLFPTANVVAGFGDISRDNRHIIRMEWINEGATLIFLGVITILTALYDFTSAVTGLVHWSVLAMLAVLSVISLFTGFKVNFLPFKLCPVIFTLSALFILAGRLALFNR